MIVQNNFQNFKTYSHYKSLAITKKQDKKDYKKFILPLIGSSLGVVSGMLATKNFKSKNRILDELVHLLAMMGGANIGSVIFSSFGKKPAEIKKKIHEGAFQIMNAAIPMLFVSGANAICDKAIQKKYPIIRVASSLSAMILGAMTATKITNATNKTKEAPRKYTIKDSVANVDDLIVTFSFGFEEAAEKLKLDYRLMPFIYAYCGMRAGAKE